MKIVFDFLKGDVEFKEFKKKWDESQEIREWVENLVDLKSELNSDWRNLPRFQNNPFLFGELIAIHKHYGGSVLKYIEVSLNQKGLSKASYEHSLFGPIALVVPLVYPDTEITSYYSDEANYYSNATSDYIGGPEVDDYLYKLLGGFPPSLGKTKRLKEAKKAINEAFHIEKGKYPFWIQFPDWPMGKFNPMKYISRKHDGDLFLYTFQDVDTGEVRVVEQFA